MVGDPIEGHFPSKYDTLCARNQCLAEGRGPVPLREDGESEFQSV